MRFENLRTLRTPKTVSSKFLGCLAFITSLAIYALVYWILVFYGVFNRDCSNNTVNGRVCNNHGTCVDGACICEPFFSGERCEETLASSYKQVTGEVCNGNGYLGASQMTNDYLSSPCRETVINELGSHKRSGGWGTSACFLDTQERVKRLVGGEGTIEDIFALPLCECKEGFSGPNCDENPCPNQVSGITCGGYGNKSVTYTHNLTRSGLGCQCTAGINRYLSRSFITSFSADQLRSIQQSPKLTSRLMQPTCGTVYQHPDNPGLMITYNTPSVSLYKCFCQENRHGVECLEGACPVTDGLICAGNGHEDFGSGAQRNGSERLSTKSRTVCTESGTVNCKTISSAYEDKCVVNTVHCEMEDLVCPKDRPIRCRDNSCVANPRRNLYPSNAFGLVENLTEVIRTKRCDATLYGQPDRFMSSEDYREALTDCIGADGNISSPISWLIPNGDTYKDSSVIAIMIETVDNSGSLMVRYRSEEQTYTELNENGSVHFFIFNETYEQEQERLYVPLELKRTITLVSDTVVEIRPSPIVFENTDAEEETYIPDEWTKIRVTTSQDPSQVILLESTGLRIDWDSEGDWFIANQTEDSTRILLMDGRTVSMDVCMEALEKCLWSSETQLSTDGTRKLCNIRTVSGRLGCTGASPDIYRRLTIVLVAKKFHIETQDTSGISPSLLITQSLSSVDWSGLGPWSVGPAVIGLRDEDFSDDGGWVTFQSSTDFTGLRSIAFIELADIAIPAACGPTTVNASTLNLNWWQETARPSDTVLNPGVKAIGLTRRFGVEVLVRGVVVNQNYLSVRGFDDPVPVSKMKRITNSEFRRGLPHESFRVFPAMCADGTPSRLSSRTFEDVEVDCSCDMFANRRMTCSCSDEFKSGYTCTCPAIDSTKTVLNTTEDLCVCNGGVEAGFHGLQSQLDEYRRNTVNAVCFLSIGTPPPAGSPDSYHYYSGAVTTTPVRVDEEGSVYINRTGNAIFLLEFRLANACVADANETITVSASSTVFSDEIETFTFDSACSEVDGVDYQTIKPVYDAYKFSAYDQWWIEGLPTGIPDGENSSSPNVTIITITPIFIPEGIPLNVSSVEVSSNDELKENVLWNNLNYWHSDDDDGRPTLAIYFDEKEIVTGVYIVFETVGLNVSVGILPLEVSIQGTKDSGDTWKTLGKFSSSVFHGSEDYWFQLSSGGASSGVPVYDGIRIVSRYYLGIREFLVMTNQLCDFDGLRLEPSSGFTSIVSHKLDQILNRPIDTSLECVCTDTCIINGHAPRDTDECVDEKYVTEVRGVTPYAMTFYRNVTVSGPFIFLSNASFDNDTLEFYGYNSSTFHVLDESDFKAWWTDDSPIAPDKTLLNLSDWTGTIRTYNDSFFYRIVNTSSEQWLWIANDTDGFPVYKWMKNMTILERGIACLSGTDCTKCGPSSRTTSKAAGVTCTLTDFEQQISDDYTNRTDHIVQNSAVLDEYIDTGLVVAKFDLITGVFTRNVTMLVRSDCSDDCYGQFRCSTGECVSSTTLCPTPRYDNPGDGCTETSPTSDKYHCVCKAGTGGNGCNLEYCTPGDPYSGKVNAHNWCSCGKDPPICFQPGMKMNIPINGYFTNELIELHNRGGVPKASALDVRNIRFYHSFAPFCVKYLRGYRVPGTNNNKVIRTNCPHAVIGPMGQTLYLEDCVYSRNPTTGEVEAWKNFTYANGSIVQFVWNNITHYDQRPFRCPKSYTCETDEAACYNKELIHPPCGFGGKCRVDGTCDCAPTKATFTYTQEWTNLTMIPYDARNPTNWLPNGEKPWSFNRHCQAKDCSDGQCEIIPYTCLPGTPEKKFQDRQVVCSDDSGFGGSCAVDAQACQRGEVTPKLVCGGNGYAVKMDYRDEYKCRCGKLVTRLASFSEGGNVTRGREFTEIEPNGWGGDYCQYYYCQENPAALHWAYVDPETDLPFRDEEGNVLPGKYIGGSCGAPIGPNPEDVTLWENACPGYSRFDHCPNVVCMIGNQPTVTTHESCQGLGRTPMVYPCHKQGRALASGQCECFTNPDRGQGYGPDVTKVGCYKRITCSIAISTGKPCNNLNGRMDAWIEYPKDRSLDSQIPMFLSRMGLPTTKRAYVKLAIKQPEKLLALLEAAYVEWALLVQRELSDAAGAICVTCGEDPSDPVAMLPYDGLEDSIGPCQKAFKVPYDLTNTGVGLDAILTDGVIQQYEREHLTNPQPDLQYVNTTQTLTHVFANETYVTHIRLYVYNPSMLTTAYLRVSNQANETICGESFVTYSVSPSRNASEPVWSWLTMTCQQQWEAVDFTTYGSAYALACLSGTRATQCLAWKDSICGSITGAQIQLPSSTSIYPGCSPLERCCRPITVGDDTVTVVKIETSSAQYVYVQEVMIFGYTSVAVSMTETQLREIRWLQGNITNETPHGGGQCLDELHLMRPEMLGFDGTFFLFREFHDFQTNTTIEVKTLSYDEAEEKCLDAGGYLAILTGTEDNDNYAKEHGNVCCADKTNLGTCDRQCFVGAKNRNEMPIPEYQQDFINEPCFTNGCYIRKDGETGEPSLTGEALDFYSCTDGTGNMWTYNWANSTLPGLTSWTVKANAMYKENERQLAMVGWYGHPTWTTAPTIDQTDYAAYSDVSLAQFGVNNPHALHSSFKWWNTHSSSAMMTKYYINQASLQTATAFPAKNFSYSATRSDIVVGITAGALSMNHPRFNASSTDAGGARSSYWVNPKVCKITLYSETHCGIDFTSTGLKGLSTTYFATPANDYQIFGANLMNGFPSGPTRFPKDPIYVFPGTVTTNLYNRVGVWEKCADGGTTCSGRGETFFNIDPKSVSVEGPCVVQTVGACTGDKCTELHRYYAEETLYNPTAPTSYSGLGGGQPVQPYGCQVQCCAGLDCAKRRDYSPSTISTWLYAGAYPQYAYQFYYSGGTNVVGLPERIGTSNLWDYSSDDLFDCHYWTEHQWCPINAASDYCNDVGTKYKHRYKDFFSQIRVYPLFDDYKVETTFRAEPGPVTVENNGTCHLFWKTHDYMCMRVQVRILKSVRGLATFTNMNDYGTVTKNITDLRVNSSVNMLVSEPVLFNSSTGLLTLENVQAMLDAGPGAIHDTIFPRCSSLGREYPECPSCVVTQPVGDWEFAPRKYYPQFREWVEKLTVMRQPYDGSAQSSELPRPVMHINMNEFFTGSTEEYVKLSELRYPRTRFYGGVIAALRVTDIHTKFDLDNCVVVKASDAPPEVTAPTVPYVFDTAVCVSRRYSALCVRDHSKNTIQRGRDCEPCGPSTRPGGYPQPGVTVFDLYPHIVEADFPVLHEAYRAMLAGTIKDLVNETEIDYDLVFDYLVNTTNRSLITVFPEFQSIAYHSNLDYSDRPGHLSDQVTTPNYENWIDIRLTKVWKVDCGRRCSKESGICHKRRAVNLRYCDPDAEQFEGAELPLSEYPLGLLPVTDPNPERIPRCAVKIDPVSYAILDDAGFPSGSIKDFVILEQKPGESIWLRITKSGRSSWQNTGKSSHGFLFRNNTVLYGEFECSAACTIAIWISQLSPSYATDPDDRVQLANFTTSPFTINLSEILVGDLAATHYRSLAWDIYGLVRGDTVKLNVILASNPTTIAECQADNPWTIYQPGSYIEYAEPENLCPFVYTEDPLTGQLVEPGTCLCLDSSYGGATCEAPSIVSVIKQDKQVCGGGGSPGFKAIDYDGNKVSVNQDGSWRSTVSGKWGCKTINPGLIFRTKLYPHTRYDFPYIYRTDSLIGQQAYMTVAQLLDDLDSDGDDITDEYLTLTYSEAVRTCSSESATIPSYYSADEVTKFLTAADDKLIFMDMELDDGYLRWVQRSTDIVACDVDTSGNYTCGQEVATNPCYSDGTTDPFCLAIQYNNLAFLASADNMTDGATETALTILNGATETVPITSTTPITVKLFLELNATITIEATNVTADYECDLTGGAYSYEYTCDVYSVTAVKITVGDIDDLITDAIVRELLVYKATDPTRFWAFYS